MYPQKQVRRSWSKEEKIFFAKMLQTPLKNGRPKTVSEVSAEYGISAKLLYEWRDVYGKHGESGFDQKERKVYESISRDIQLVDKLLDLSLLHPDWGAKKLIAGLKTEYPETYIPSIPTVLKILHQNNLGTSEQRYGATELSYLKADLALPDDLIESLFKRNPYLRLLELNSRVNGLLFLLKSIPLPRYFGKSSSCLLIAIEANSLMTFGRSWDGKDSKDLWRLIESVSTLGKGKAETDVYFLAENQNVFNKITDSINLINTITDAEKTVYFESMKLQFNAIRHFLRHYHFVNAQKFDEDFDNYLLKYLCSCTNYGYPTMGENPYVAMKNYQQRSPFCQIPLKARM